MRRCILSAVCSAVLLVAAGSFARAQQLQSTGNNQQGTANQGTASTGFNVQGPQLITGEQLRASRQPGQLVGGQVQGVGALRSQTQAAGAQATNQAARFGAQGRFGSPFNQFNQFNQFARMYNARSSSLYNQRQQLRFPLLLGSGERPRVEPARVAANIQKRLARIPQLRGNGSVRVEMNDQVAVLRGAVASEHERVLLARLVLLEPGVADVRNELQVVAAAPKAKQ